MSNDISIKNGANLNLKGLASKNLEVAKPSLTYALNPDDFFALIPRMLVKEGDKVSQGQPILIDKKNDKIKIVSPVSGIVKQIVRGDKRKILTVIIKKDGDEKVKFDVPDLKKISSEEIFRAFIQFWFSFLHKTKTIQHYRKYKQNSKINFCFSSQYSSLFT